MAGLAGQCYGPSLGLARRLGVRFEENMNEMPEETEDVELLDEVDVPEEHLGHLGWKEAQKKARRLKIAESRKTNVKIAVSPEEWKESNEKMYKQADKTYHKAMQCRAEATKLRNTEELETERRQEKAGHKLKERVEDTIFWREEVEAEIGRWKVEQEKLREIEKKLAQAHKQTGRPAKINDKCLKHRKERIGPDLVMDVVEESLIAEMEKIRTWQRRITTTQEQVQFQMRLNHDVVRALGRNLDSMTRASKIDTACTKLNNKNNRLMLHTGADDVTVPPSWKTDMQKKIDESKKIQEWSQLLRADVETLARSMCTEIHNQWRDTNKAMSNHIQVLKHSIRQLGERQENTAKEIKEQQKETEKLKSSIQAKGPPLKLAQTRLNMRTQRGGRMRQVWEDTDQSQTELLAEVTRIMDNLQLLNTQLRQEEKISRELANTKQRLDYDIKVKNHSLEIDAEKCLATRKELPLHFRGNWQKYLDKLKGNKGDSGNRVKRRRPSEISLDQVEP